MKTTIILAAWLLSSLCAWAQPVKSQFFKTSDGLSLHYLEAGSGQPTLVFVPGWLMPAEIFEQQVLALSADHRVHVLDPRGRRRRRSACKQRPVRETSTNCCNRPKSANMFSLAGRWG